ncbi:MAG TPA: hypothetical protein VJ986_03140 [Gaiellaceae bacterium]|nr:hypothetical protein [Gaiellaceae bacterium]
MTAGGWLLAAVFALSACAAPATSTTSDSAARPEPETAAALVAIAQTFNDDYGRGVDGPVYDRWDARSRAVISRAEYLRRHAECPTAPTQPAQVEGAAPGPHGTWLVRYRIGDQQFIDHWIYSGGRWQFDLVSSNPDAVRLYRLPGPQYVAAVGCARH